MINKSVFRAFNDYRSMPYKKPVQVKTMYHIATGNSSKTRYSLCEFSTSRKKEAIAFANKLARQTKTWVFVVNDALANIIDQMSYIQSDHHDVIYATF